MPRMQLRDPSGEVPWIWELHTARTQNTPMPTYDAPIAAPQERVRQSTIAYPNTPRALSIHPPSAPHPTTTPHRPIARPPNTTLSNPYPPNTNPAPSPLAAYLPTACPPTTSRSASPLAVTPAFILPQSLPRAILRPEARLPASQPSQSSIAPPSITPPSSASPPSSQAFETSLSYVPRKQLAAHTRTQLCTLWNLAGWSYFQIHAIFPHIPLSTIATTIREEPPWHYDEIVPDEVEFRAGAPRKLGEEDKTRIFEAIDTDPRITWAGLEKVIDRRASGQTIRRFLKGIGRQRPPDFRLIHAHQKLAMLADTSPGVEAEFDSELDAEFELELEPASEVGGETGS